MPPDSLRGDKLLEQSSRKLNGLSVGATDHHMLGRPAIIVQILIRCDTQVKFVPVHGITMLPANSEKTLKASTPVYDVRPIAELTESTTLPGVLTLGNFGLASRMEMTDGFSPLKMRKGL
jgi:hypothetical protein